MRDIKGGGPQIIITLSPRGEIVAELPGANGSRRIVPVHGIDQLRRMLYGQIRGEKGIGTEAEPTEHLLIHWRDHKKKSDGKCPFCRSEADAVLTHLAVKRKPAADLLKELGLL